MLPLHVQNFPLLPNVPHPLLRPHQKIEFHLFLHAPCPSSDRRPNIGKKGTSNSFQTNFSLNFANGVHFYEQNHDLFGNPRWNNIVEINFITVFTQNYVPLHTPPPLAKNVTTFSFAFSPQPGVDCLPFPQILVGKLAFHATGFFLYTLKP